VPNWSQIESAAPELAAAVRARFDAYRHLVLATLRADGSPRLSGIETTFRDGELWLGMMPGSRKAMDLRRDPRLALHSPPVDEELAEGDARISGEAEEVTGAGAMQALVEGDERHAQGAPDGHVFRVDVRELLLLKVGDPPDHLVIETWREGRGLRRVERR
jgi:Pyridoxamine 5'-phosphate oxidase